MTTTTTLSETHINVVSCILDHRVKAANVLIEISIGDYLKIADYILDKNDFQRRRVIRGKVNQFLKADLEIGCSIPPIVLAILDETEPEDDDYKSISLELAEKRIQAAFEQKSLLILDGLQRTNVMLDVAADIRNDYNQKEAYLKGIIRAEIYVGIKRERMLYRMLTLNTGQTTMSSRHLMEILYYNYRDVNLGDGLRFVSDKDSESVKTDDIKTFKFKDVLDGFHSFVEKDELPIEKVDILTNIHSLENLKEIENKKNIFKEYFDTYYLFLQKMDSLFSAVTIDKDNANSYSEYPIKGSLFGKNTTEIFKKSQAISGFGAVCGDLSERGINLAEIRRIIEGITCQDEEKEEFVIAFLYGLDKIKEKSQRLGNEQRGFFRRFFSFLLDKDDNKKCFQQLFPALTRTIR